ncbi:MAG: hypothetical protein IT461_02440 [Planctomycetes bacterium]|nr:hypothetical protein [Planctomycetota bacterium]
MRKEARIRTDTATIVLFDPLRLESRKNDVCDWWTGDGDLDIEEAAANLVFVDTGIDGVFEVAVTTVRATGDGQLVKSTVIEVPSGELLFGAGEHLPGEGTWRSQRLTPHSVERGTYRVGVCLPKTELKGGTALYVFVLELLKQTA